MKAILLYWLSAQRKTSTFRQQRFGFSYLNVVRKLISLVLISKVNSNLPKMVKTKKDLKNAYMRFLEDKHEEVGHDSTRDSKENYFLWCLDSFSSPYGNLTGTPRRIDVDITSIRQRPNFDEFPRHFHLLFRCNFGDRKIPVVSTYFFRCNFNGRKVHVFSTYFFRYNFDGRKIHVISMYFFRCNFACQKIHVVSTYFFRCNFDGQKIYVVCCFHVIFLM